jgi:uncharacterized membrane protein
VLLPLAPALITTGAWGVNGNGSVIVGSGGSDSGWFSPANSWTNGVYTALISSGYAIAVAVNSDGTVIAGQDSETAVSWVSGGSAKPLLPGAPVGSATGVSASGTVIVGNTANGIGGNLPFRWTSSGVTMLYVYPPGNGVAQGVSGDGTVVVGDDNGEAMKWAANGTATDLANFGSTLPGTAYAASQDGTIIVGSNYTFAFIWDYAHGPRFLSAVLTGVSGVPINNLAATGISADGKIAVGWANDVSGSIKAWIANLP